MAGKASGSQSAAPPPRARSPPPQASRAGGSRCSPSSRRPHRRRSRRRHGPIAVARARLSRGVGVMRVRSRGGARTRTRVQRLQRRGGGAAEWRAGGLGPRPGAGAWGRGSREIWPADASAWEARPGSDGRAAPHLTRCRAAKGDGASPPPAGRRAMAVDPRLLQLRRRVGGLVLTPREEGAVARDGARATRSTRDWAGR